MIYAYSDGEGSTLPLPYQKLTTKEKIEKYGSVNEWAVATINALDGIIFNSSRFGTSSIHNKHNMYVNLGLVEHGIFDKSDFEEILYPYGREFKYEFPVSLTHYPIINSKVEVLKGEEIARPLNFMVVDKSSDGFNRTQELRSKLVLDVLTNELLLTINKKGLEEGLSKDQSGEELDSIEKVNKYMSYGYSDLLEEKLTDLLRYFIDADQLKYKFNKNFTRLLCTGSEIYHLDIISGTPTVRVVNPLYYDCDTSGETDFLDGATWSREYEYVSVSEITARYAEYLTDEDIEHIENNRGINNVIGGFNDFYPSFNSSVNNYNYIRVCHFEWVTLKKIGFLTVTDLESGEIVEKDVVDEDYKKQYRGNPSVKEEVKWEWVNDRWRGIKIGSSVYIRLESMPRQYDTIESFSKSSSSYIGTRSNFSLVDKLKPYQYLYNVLWFQLKKLMAASKGKAFVMDVSQIPTSHGFTWESWLHALDLYNVAPINSLEIDENSKKQSSFNQFQTVDRSMGDAINSFIQQFQFIEQQMGQVCGVTPQREGQVHQNETYGGVERSVTQSNSITESLFYIHNECKRRVIERMMDMAKIAFKEGVKMQYVMDDLGRKLIEINESDFKNSEFGIVISNSGEDAKNLQSLKDAAMMALQQQQISLKDFADTIITKSMAKVRNLLIDAEKHNQEKQQAQQEAQGQQAQQQQQAQLQFEQQRVQIETESKLQVEQLKADTAIRVAEIAAESKVMAFRDDVPVDRNNNGTIDAIERDKLALEREIKNRELNIKQQEVDVKKQDSETKKKDLSIQKEQMNTDLELSKNELKKQDGEIHKMNEQSKLEAIKLKQQKEADNQKLKSTQLLNKEKLSAEKQKLSITKEKKKLSIKKPTKKK